MILWKGNLREMISGYGSKDVEVVCGSEDMEFRI